MIVKCSIVFITLCFVQAIDARMPLVSNFDEHIDDFNILRKPPIKKIFSGIKSANENAENIGRCVKDELFKVKGKCLDFYVRAGDILMLFFDDAEPMMKTAISTIKTLKAIQRLIAGMQANAMTMNVIGFGWDFYQDLKYLRPEIESLRGSIKDLREHDSKLAENLEIADKFLQEVLYHLQELQETITTCFEKDYLTS